MVEVDSIENLEEIRLRVVADEDVEGLKSSLK